jgi:carboxyl-terminal processing protease
VTLSILRKGQTTPKDYKITRDVITVKSVTAWVKKVSDIDSVNLDKSLANEKVAYINLSQFGDNTNSEWLSAINQMNLDIEKAGGVKGIVFDLRNNPGGYLTDAVFVASEFLPEGSTVVSEEDKTGSHVLKTNRKGLFADKNIPLVVLINKGSASASEIVAGSLRDNNRAELVGETSFGKGTVQQAEDLGGGSGLHVTIAKWLTPNGTWVNGKGLTPDVSASLDTTHPDEDNQLGKAILELFQK